MMVKEHKAAEELSAASVCWTSDLSQTMIKINQLPPFELCVRELANFKSGLSVNHPPIDLSADEVLWKTTRFLYQNVVQIALVGEQQCRLILTINNCFLALGANSSKNVRLVNVS